MSKRRVVVTGVGLVSPIGDSLPAVGRALVEKTRGISRVEAWAAYEGVATRLAGVVADPDLRDVSRKHMRAMGRVAQLSVAATRQALEQAGIGRDVLQSGRASLFYGSTDGSTGAAEDYYRKLYTTDSFAGLLSSQYLKFMSHTCAANIASVFGVTGRVIPICSACTSASQAIGEGYWSIATGRDAVAICGGAEEVHFTVAGVFDLMLATSTNYNDRPELTPRPFDTDRDGLIIAEGAGTLILEDWDHAQSRGARAWAEIVGYGNNCDGLHLTSPSPGGMAGAMRRALADARLDPGQIDYVNAHATGTEIGDIAESQATMEVLGPTVPISSTKSYTGHTLGGCGAIESVFVMAMLAEGFVPPTLNLDRPDPRCAPLDYVQGDSRAIRAQCIMNNNFAFGGINTSLIFARV